MTDQNLNIARRELQEFLGQEFQSRQAVCAYSEEKRWERIIDPEDREHGAPTGKLAFEDFETWFVPDDIFVRASWASFILPGETGVLGTMTLNETWTVAGDERFWFDLGVALFDADPIAKIEEADETFSWNWAFDPEPKGSNFRSFRFVPLGDDVTKFSYIRTHRTAPAKD
ncbi:MAG: hypothetical protein AAFQ96_02435 [Pseudomonadota bacterium]